MKQHLDMIKLIVILLLIPVVCTALDSIGSFTATGKYGKIALSWENPVNSTKTDIIRSMNKYPETITEGILVYSGTGSSYEDTGLVKDIAYYYVAFAYDGVNYSNPATASATPISDITPPSSPGTPTENSPDIDIIATGKWLLQWDTQSQDEESGISYYEVEERVNNGSWTLVQYVSGDTGTASFSNKQSGRVYYYRLRAVNRAGLSGSYSVSSDGIRVVNKTMVLPATVSVVSAGQDGKFALVDVPTNAYASGTIFGISQIIPPQTDLLQADPPIEKLLGNAWQIVAVDGDNNLIQPASNMMLIVSYPDSNANEIEDMERYRLYQLKEGADVWVIVSGSQTVLGTNNMIQVAIGSLSTYVVAKLRDTVPPEPIGSFTVTGGEHEVNLLWKNPGDGDFVYTTIVKQADRFPGSPTDGSVIYIGTGTEYIDATVTDSTSYYYAGFSWDGTNYSTVTTGSATVKDNIPPAGVGSFTATGKTGKVELDWINPLDTDFGWVEILRNASDFPATRTGCTPIYVGTGTMYVDITKITNGITYYYTIFAYDKVGNFGTASHATATPSIDTPPSAPGTVTEGYFDADVVIYQGIWTVFWGAATDEESGISSYELQQRINDGEWKTIGNVAGTATSVSGFWGSVGNIYYHRLRAMNGNGMWGSYTVSDGIRVVNSAEYVQSGSLKWITVDGSGISMNVSGGTETEIITVSQETVGNLPFNLLGKAYRVAVINEANEEIQPQGSITLTLFYPDPDTGDEEADKGYRIYWLDADGWKIVPGEQRVEPASNQITITLNHLSVYAVGIPINEIMVYPNPFNPGRYADHTMVSFKGWNGYASIRIYKLNGELIEELDGQDMKEWVPSTDIASGVYIYVIEVRGGQKSSGKLAIIR
ncbi:MAG: T9SS type A sorting domain-containing protein [Candidatus Desantisbacteria bacterium]